ncbi:MAG: carbohydrate ABC transporter permease [Clostridia bacterium]|nr:carbohydrate ABC transporter permease [Clostridia bacterium]
MDTAFKNKKSLNKNLNPFVIFLFVVLLIYSLTLIFMISWGFMTSLKNEYDFHGGRGHIANYLGLPRFSIWKDKSVFTNYESVMGYFNGGTIPANKNYWYGFNLDIDMTKSGYAKFIDLLSNSILYAICGSVVIALVPALVGYLCAKYPYKFSSLIYTITIVVMVLPLVSATPSKIVLMQRLCIFDTIYGDVIVNMMFPNMYFLVFYAFFQGVSGTYSEAAEVDGASQFRILVTIVMPLAVKMMTTVILIYFIGRWNDYATPLLYLPSHPTLSLAVQQVIQGSNIEGMTGTPAKIAATMTVALPMIILFICVKDRLLGNISMGGIKE